MFTFALRSIMLSCSVLQQSSNQTKRGHNQKVLEEEGNGWNYAARSLFHEVISTAFAWARFQN